MARTMPHHIDAEQSVLGVILLDPGKIVAVVDGLRSDDFFIEGHKIVYETMISLFEAGASIDYTSVAASLEKSNKLVRAGGIDYLIELSDFIASTAHLETYINIVKDASLKRQVINLTGKIMEETYVTDQSANDFLDYAETEIFALAQQRKTTDFIRIDVLLDDVKRKIEENKNKKGQVTGLATGFSNLDAITLGLQPEELLILAARPAMGKSAFAMNLALNIAERNKDGKASIAIFSLEMGNDQLVSRMYSAIGLIPGNKIRSGHLSPSEWQSLEAARNELKQRNIFFDDSAAVTVSDIRAKCRKLSQEGNLDFVIIDYLQLIKGDVRSGNRQEEVARISRALKQMARELKVPVMALSQLSREVEKRDDKKPILADLRESGSIEQDADIVMFLYREDYYAKKSSDDAPVTVSKTDLIIAKNRQGLSGVEISYRFETEYSRFLVEETRYDN